METPDQQKMKEKMKMKAGAVILEVKRTLTLSILMTSTIRSDEELSRISSPSSKLDLDKRRNSMESTVSTRR